MYPPANAAHAFRSRLWRWQPSLLNEKPADEFSLCAADLVVTSGEKMHKMAVTDLQMTRNPANRFIATFSDTRQQAGVSVGLRVVGKIHRPFCSISMVFRRQSNGAAVYHAAFLGLCDFAYR